MKTVKARRAIILLGLSLIIILAVMTLYYFQQYGRGDRFLPGVEISSISVEGKNKEEVKELLAQETKKIYEHSIRFYGENYHSEYTFEQMLEPMDVGQVVEAVWKQEESLSMLQKWKSTFKKQQRDYPVSLTYKKDQQEKLLKEWNKRWAVAVANATIKVDTRGLTVVPSKPGKAVDAKATFAALPVKMNAIDDIEVPVKLMDVQPKVKAETLKNMGELGSYSTRYNAGEVERSSNLQKAANAVNGSMIQPGSVFSFNKTVGQRTIENGYKDAMVIVGDKFEPGLGGGICQVSSTLYNAFLYAGLDIIERHNHGLSVTYVPMGRDATVAYGLLDLKVRNHTDYPIYIRAVAGGGTLTVNVYGDRSYNQKIALRTIVDQQIPQGTVTEKDPTLQPGEVKVVQRGFPGYVVRSFRDFLNDDGSIEMTEQLAVDRYRPLTKRILEGPEAVQAPTPNPETPAQPGNEGETPVEPVAPTETDGSETVAPAPIPST